MTNDNVFKIEIPEMEIEVGSSQTTVVKITNITEFFLKHIEITADILDSEIMGVIPDSLQPFESFQMQLTISAKTWNPDGIKGQIKINAMMVSR